MVHKNIQQFTCSYMVQKINVIFVTLFKSTLSDYWV